MSIIYEPKGRAREYSELAVNLYTGCSHKCLYCYCPSIMRRSLDEWANNPLPRKNILSLLDKEASKRVGETREVLLSFMADPYMSVDASKITGQALLIFEKYRFKNISVLTKGGLRAVEHFDILSRNGWKFGSTIIFADDVLRQKYEPNASEIISRYNAIIEAKKRNIYTWVSVEPVIDINSALQVMIDLKPHVNKWKVGKLNHQKSENNWISFYNQAKEILNGCDVYWKQDLLESLKGE